MRVAGQVSRVLLTDLLAVVAGFGAVLLAARQTSQPAWLFAAGLLATAGVLAAGLLAALRPHQRHRPTRQARRVMTGAALGIAMAATVATVLPGGQDAPRRITGAGYWQLPTGSRLQYLHAPATQSTRPANPPVVILHGGPGVADLEADLTSFLPLTAAGHDLYAYAQLGSGGSSRLTDPRGYGRDRDVADLEAVRQRLGASRLVLIGHSYGSGVAAAYAARYPQRVSRMMLISPVPLDPADTSPNLARSRLRISQDLPISLATLQPRPLLTYLLLQVNPRAAVAFMGDREADQRNDEVLAHAEPALHCAGGGPHRPTSQSGFYAMQYPQSAAAPRPADLRAALRRVDVPTVIVKGSCDYLSWDSAVDYRRALRNSSLMYLNGAGHNAHHDRPSDVVRAARELLEGRPPAHPYEGPPPPDYEGPATGRDS